MKKTAVLFALLMMWLSNAVTAAQDAVTPPAEIVPTHPLDALTPKEIAQAADLLKAQGAADKNTMFGAVTLLEPAKSEVLAWREGDAWARKAFVVFGK